MIAKWSDLIAAAMSSYFPQMKQTSHAHTAGGRARHTATGRQHAKMPTLVLVHSSAAELSPRSENHCVHANFRRNSNWNDRDNAMKVEKKN